MRAWLGILLCVSLCGCSNVYSTKPAGEDPADISREAKEWEGVWQFGDNAIRVVVRDASNGLLKIGWTESRGDDIEFKTGPVELRTHGDWVFASIRDEESTNGTRYLWGRIKRNGRQALLWGPDPDQFEELVEQGRLPGTNDSSLIIGDLGPEHYAILTNGMLYSWDEPLIFTKSPE